MVESRRNFPHDQSAPIGEQPYVPPQVEAVVTADDLNREALYAGPAGYGPI